jgi:hypothetical protein
LSNWVGSIFKPALSESPLKSIKAKIVRPLEVTVALSLSIVSAKRGFADYLDCTIVILQVHFTWYSLFQKPTKE